jgi:hypothetical protein
MGRRARDRIVMFYSPYGVKRWSIPDWLSLKTGLGSKYNWTEGKELLALRALLKDERDALLSRLIRLEEKARPLWSFVTVKRDREWYGIIPHSGDRLSKFPHFRESNLIWERDLIRFSNQPIGGRYVENPGPDKLQHVFDMIKEMVYREPF